jgi:hypothetical protein
VNDDWEKNVNVERTEGKQTRGGHGMVREEGRQV